MNSNDFESILMQDSQWCRHLGFRDLDGLNDIIAKGKAVQLVNLCEARHENRFSEIAEDICKRPEAKIILLAGPSSSGKTGAALRIALQCKVHGLNPHTVELDNYFINREDTPRLPTGEYDYECLEAMDLELLNRHLTRLIDGEEVTMPRYDFESGRRVAEGDRMRIGDGDVLILEGIHALDPAMTPEIAGSNKYHIYVSDISFISESGSDFKAADNRLLRRMVRDGRTRGYEPEETIRRWADVRRGEEKYVFPFQNNADSIFNSTVQYELPLLKRFVEPSLHGIRTSSPVFKEAERLLSVLSRIEPLPEEAIGAIPCTSIVREFIGGQVLSRQFCV